MNELIIREDFQKCFPSMMDGIRKATEIFDSIKSFKDIERYFLLGAGLSPNTYKTYLSAVKGFYNYTEGMNPLQVIPADLERYYDHIMQTVDRNTAYIKIMGLKKFFKGIGKVIPFYTSPFDIMSEELKRKLSKTKTGTETKLALSRNELIRVFEYLDRDTSLKGLQNRAIIRILVSTGLRAAELCQAKWKDIEYEEETGIYYLHGIGKGEKVFRQEIADKTALDALTTAYKVQFGHDPDPNDHLIYSLESYKGKEPAGMKKSTMWVRLKDISTALKAEKIIRENIQFSAHLFRRTYLTLLVKSGMDIASVQKHSRHSSVQTLIDHYVDTNEKAGKHFKEVMEGAA